VAPAVGLFTSGTSGAPKFVPLSHDNLVNYVLNTVEAGSAQADEAALISTPPYHIAALTGVLSNVFRGRRIVLLPDFDAATWLSVAATERITHAMVVPTMLSRIVDTLENEPELWPDSLISVAYGGSRCPPGLVERALRVLPKRVGMVNAFGLTETSSTVAMLTPEDHRAAFESEDAAVGARLDSVGRPVPGVEIRIAGRDGAVAGPRERGEIQIRGAQVSAGSSKRLSPDGWLQTGDSGRLDEAGYVFVLGRLDDVIIRGGENIDPTEIEAALILHEEVREAVVVGLPDPDWGQVVGALVTGDRALDQAELQAWVRRRLAGYKVPTVIRWAPELPRNDLGKVVRCEAVALLLSPVSRSDV
jgi:acyl-CoA synthetase (AMP-forming)/AMP-acid ligase II